MSDDIHVIIILLYKKVLFSERGIIVLRGKMLLCTFKHKHSLEFLLLFETRTLIIANRIVMFDLNNNIR